MGNRFSSSSLTTNVVISKRGSTSLLMVKTSSGASCRTFSIKLRRSATLDFAFDKISRLDKFAALAVSIACSLFDDLRAFLVQELVTAIGAEKLDLLVPQFLPVAIELAVALGAGYPKNFRHGSSWHQQNKIRNKDEFSESLFTTETQSSQSLLISVSVPSAPPR